MPLKLRYTDVRAREVAGRSRVGLRHTASDEEGRVIKTEWIEMSPDDARTIVQALQTALQEFEPEQ